LEDTWRTLLLNKKNQIYKNSPLIETVFEIRFPSEIMIECHRDKFYNKVREKYPQILLPRTVPGQAMAFEPYRFESNDGYKGIMLAINKLAFYCKKYEGFDPFKKETISVFSIFKELFNIRELKRAGLRYVNIIPFMRENNMIPIENFLNIKILFPNSIITNFKNLSMSFVSPIGGDDSIAMQIESVISHDKKKEGIRLDFDCTQEGELEFLKIDQYLEKSHKNTKDLFEKLITEDYKKVMRGEVIE
jgi:uncharacterized protein (TIGR04255 family)